MQCAYHALALDDERRTFHPVLWDESDPKDHARLQQVWFPGVHANVGGGYPKDGLAYISLEWIVTKARALGLDFLDAHLTEIRGQVDAHDQLYNSRAGLAGFYGYSPRPITTLGHDTLNDVTIDRPKVHASVFARIHGEHVAYAPIGLPPVYDLVLRDGTMVPGDKSSRGSRAEHARLPLYRIPRESPAARHTYRGSLEHRLVATRRLFSQPVLVLFLGSLPPVSSGWSTQQTLPGLRRGHALSRSTVHDQSIWGASWLARRGSAPSERSPCCFSLGSWAWRSHS